jgi:hypothetical protein
MTDDTFFEEYGRRSVAKEPRGDEAIIGDRTGRHLKPYDITMPEFLAEQVIYRIKFKYQQSDFPPTNDDEEEILKVINETVAAYDFKDFNSVRLDNLNSSKTYDFNKEQLKTFIQK